MVIITARRIASPQNAATTKSDVSAAEVREKPVNRKNQKYGHVRPAGPRYTYFHFRRNPVRVMVRLYLFIYFFFPVSLSVRRPQ